VASGATNWLTDTTDDRTQLELLNLSANGLRSLLHISNVEKLHSLILGMARLRGRDFASTLIFGKQITIYWTRYTSKSQCHIYDPCA